jgi:hypothetical protein
MSENHEHAATPDPEQGRGGRTGAITRATVAVAAGAATGWTTRDVGLGITTATAALNILREFTRPAR